MQLTSVKNDLLFSLINNKQMLLKPHLFVYNYNDFYFGGSAMKHFDYGNKRVYYNDKALEFSQEDQEDQLNDLMEYHKENEENSVIIQSPYHEVITTNMVSALQDYLKRINSEGIVVTPHRDPEFIGEKFIPDVVVLLEKDKHLFFETTPPLILEIISPANKPQDTILKRQVYKMFEIPEYWVVYPFEKCIKVFSLKGNKYISNSYYNGEIIKSDTLKGFEISLEDLF